MSKFSRSSEPELPREVDSIHIEKEAFRFERWSARGIDAEQLFQRFVPQQYEDGFCWRCRAIEKGEQERTVLFEDHSDAVRAIIAGNADLLLALYESYPEELLDEFRKMGEGFIDRDLPLDFTAPIPGDYPVLSEEMGRKHHELWLDQYNHLVGLGEREPGHRGALPYEDLPPIEQEVLKAQALANWRVLALLSDEDYELVKEVSRWKQFGASLKGYPDSALQAGT